MLVVIFVSDELDCSYAPAHGDIFTAANDTFWLDPNVGPRSGICWEAGSVCTGDGAPYDACVPANYGANGEIDVSDDAAVLQPLSRYVADLDPARSMAFGLVGVPSGYAEGSEPLTYWAPEDDQQASQFGVDWSCADAEGGHEALPPLRLREVVESTTAAPSLFSICDSSYETTMATIRDRILARLP
ncbi:MAG: hypothetical protein V3V08_07405 [Nannocystaceae bacterium]